MEDKQLKQLWQSYADQLEASLALSRKNAEEITQMKIHNFLGSMKPIKIFTLFIGLLWVIFVDSLIITLFHHASVFFLISASIQVILTKLAIGIYLYQLVLIYQVDIGAPILATQEKLASLRSSTLWSARVLFLQLPVWTTFYLNASMLENGSPVWYMLQVVITLSFTWAAIWLFRNIRFENRDKKWFRLIFQGKEWDPVIRSIDLLEEIERFKKD
jgi:hypothetical protein